MGIEQVAVEIKSNMYNFGIAVLELSPNILTAVALLIIGIFTGKFIKWILKKILVKGLKLNVLLKHGFMDTILVVVKWAIYVVFLQAAMAALKIPGFSDYLSEGLGIIPGLIGSVLILIVGYAVANYFKTGLAKIERENWTLLSNILFIFIVYISICFALRAVFVGSEALASNIILIVTGIGGASIAWYYVASATTKRKRGSHGRR